MSPTLRSGCCSLSLWTHCITASWTNWFEYRDFRLFKSPVLMASLCSYYLYYCHAAHFQYHKMRRTLDKNAPRDGICESNALPVIPSNDIDWWVENITCCILGYEYAERCQLCVFTWEVMLMEPEMSMQKSSRSSAAHSGFPSRLKEKRILGGMLGGLVDSQDWQKWHTLSCSSV